MMLIPDEGAVLQLIPASGAVEFYWRRDDQMKPFRLPLIAYAVVVSWSSAAELTRELDGKYSSAPRLPRDEDHGHGYSTCVEPVVLADNGQPTTWSELREDWDFAYRPDYRVVTKEDA